MTSLRDLYEQKHSLEKKIAEIKAAERGDAIEKARALIGEHDLTPDDLFRRIKAPTQGKLAAAKYRDPETGKTWSGRGRTPLWLEGKNRDDFAI